MLNKEQRIKNLSVPARGIDVVIDTDAYNEIDDQFAITYALRAKEKLNIKALYAAPFLNSRSASPVDGMEKSYREIKRLLALLKEDRPVFKGSGTYLPDEKTPIVSPAADHLSSFAMDYTSTDPLYIAAIGAITNIASAILLNPEIIDRIVVVWLGGHALEWPDNQEFNIRQDIAAARVVFDSGAPLIMLPCQGVVSHFLTTGPELKYLLEGQNTLCDYLITQAVTEAELHTKYKAWSRVIWDVACVGYLLNEQNRFMEFKTIPTPIPQYDHHYSFDPGRPLCNYVYAINRDALMDDLINRLRA